MSAAAESYDVVIVGGGLAGLSAAAGFGATGVKVLCADPTPPVTNRDQQGADLRTTAILQPGQALLERIGVWPRFAPHASDLQIMRIVDAGGQEIAPRLSCDFDAGDLGQMPFGWNLPNWLLRRELLAHLEMIPSVTLRFGVALESTTARLDNVLIRLSDGDQIAAQFLVAADGRNSTVRQSLNIGVRRQSFDQMALAFAVTHPTPHANVSTEIHRSGGPFTLVPLPDHEGTPCSAVVWMERNAAAHRLMNLDPDQFNIEATERSCGLFGPLSLAGKRSIWPMLAQVAHRFHGPRIALMAEAAHVVPPIGAQGLNMSLADLDCLLDLFGEDGADLGDPDALLRYDRLRRPEVTARVFGVGLLNRLSMVDPQPLRDLRKSGLGLIYGLAPVRKLMMRAGLGTRDT